MKVGKKRKEAEAKYDNTKSYTLLEACNILKQISTTKFDASVDIDVRLRGRFCKLGCGEDHCPRQNA